MKKRIISIIAVVLVLAAVMAQLAACDNKRGIEKSVPEYVYKRTDLPMPESMDHSNAMFVNGDRIYVLGSSYSDYVRYILYSINQDGTQPLERDLDFSLDLNNKNEDVYPSYFLPIAGDRFLTLLETWSYDEKTGNYESGTYIATYDTEGNRTALANLREKLKGVIDQDYFYANGAAVDAEGDLYIVFESEIYILDENFNYKFKIEVADTQNAWINRIFNFADGKIAISMGIDSTEGYRNGLFIVDKQARRISEELETSEHMRNNSYGVFSGQDGSIYYHSESGIFKYDPNTKESKELLNWINSDIDSPSMNNLSAVNDKRFVYVSYDYGFGFGIPSRGANELVVLDYVPPEDVVPKYIVSLGTPYGGYDVKRAVISFNRKNQDYRIVIKDYADDGKAFDYDYDDIIERINNDIISGNVPDILMIPNEMPIASYAAKGIFADLNKYMEKDDSFNRDAYFSNVLDAMSFNNKLYTISPSFNVLTVAIKSKHIPRTQTGWTMQDLNALLASLPDDVSVFNTEDREGIMQMAIAFSYNQLVDKDSGVTRFDSPEFIELLKFVKPFSDRNFWDNIDYENLPPTFWEDLENAYAEDRALLNIAYFSDFDTLRSLKAYTFKDEFTFVGFPNSQKEGSAILVDNRFAVSARSKLADGGWEFVKYLLAEEYQSTITYGWPLSINAFDKLAEDALHYEDEGTIKPMIDSIGPMLPWENLAKLTEEDVDYAKRFIQSVNSMMPDDLPVFEIIQEEAEFYFAGTKSAEETAKVIQSRVQIYISENR